MTEGAENMNVRLNPMNYNKVRPARYSSAGRSVLRKLCYRTLLMASHRGPMLVGVMPATLMRPDPTI